MLIGRSSKQAASFTDAVALVLLSERVSDVGQVLDIEVDQVAGPAVLISSNWWVG